MNWQEVDRHAKMWIKEAGEKIKESFTSILNIETKSNANDLVTNMDREIEGYFLHKIKQYYPAHVLLGEEGTGEKVTSLEGIVWIIDPIDGTMNFVHQQRNFAISIGIYENGVGKIGLIYDVMRDELYHAIKGQGAFLNEQRLSPLKQTVLEEAVIGLSTMWVTPNRRIDHHVLLPLLSRVRGTRSYGSAALEMAYVASGKLDAYITLRLSPWDFAAGVILVEEVGGVCRTLKGERLNFLEENTIFIANRSFYEPVLSEYLLGKL